MGEGPEEGWRAGGAPLACEGEAEGDGDLWIWEVGGGFPGDWWCASGAPLVLPMPLGAVGGRRCAMGELLGCGVLSPSPALPPVPPPAAVHAAAASAAATAAATAATAAAVVVLAPTAPVTWPPVACPATPPPTPAPSSAAPSSASSLGRFCLSAVCPGLARESPLVAASAAAGAGPAEGTPASGEAPAKERTTLARGYDAGTPASMRSSERERPPPAGGVRFAVKPGGASVPSGP